MNRLHFLQSVAGLGAAGIFITDLNSGNEISIDDIVEIWEISKELTLEFADAMPQSDYLFRPADLEDVYTYGGQMQHIAQNNINLISRYITDVEPPDIALDSEDNKAAITEHISQSFDYGTAAIREINKTGLMGKVEFAGRQLPRWHVLFVPQDHTTHHCGQAVVYLNANGISPPNYRKW